MTKVSLQSAAKTEDGLTLKQEEFCTMYTNPDREVYGNGVLCYLEVFGKDKIPPMSYKVAAVLATRELKKVNIIKRINALLETGGFTEENVDKQHLFLINQHADLKTKLGAVKEFNELKGRIIKKAANLNLNLNADEITPELEMIAKDLLDNQRTDLTGSRTLSKPVDRKV